MMRRHLIIIGLWACGTGFSVLHASDGGYLLQLTSDKRVPVQRLLGEGDTSSAAPLTEHRLSPEDRYTPEKGYGYDLLASPDKAAIALIMSPYRYPTGTTASRYSWVTARKQALPRYGRSRAACFWKACRRRKGSSARLLSQSTNVHRKSPTPRRCASNRANAPN